MTWIATSGITDPADLALCAGVGVDAVGVVVDYPAPVPWDLSLDEAEVLLVAPPRGPERIVVVGEDPDLAVRAARLLDPDVVHLHADASAERTERTVGLLHGHGIRVMRTLRVQASGNDEAAALRSARRLAGTGIDLLMVDLVGPAPAPAAGQQAPAVAPGLRVARAVRQAVDVPVVLAGGLRPDNVGRAIELVAPYGST